MRARHHHGAYCNDDPEQGNPKYCVDPRSPNTPIGCNATIHRWTASTQHLNDGATFVYSVYDRTVSEVSLKYHNLDRIDEECPDTDEDGEDDQQAAQFVHLEFEAIKVMA